MDHDFDALVDQSRMGHNKTGEQSLWKAAMSLPEWFFVASSGDDDAEPLVGSLEGKPALLIFTDADRAADFAKRRNMRKSDARGSARDPAAMESGVLNMDVADAIDYASQLGKVGAERALFNSGGYAFQSSIIELPDLQRRYGAG